MTKKILIFELKSVCYNSYLYFEDRLGEQLSRHGYTVEYFKLSQEPYENIERYCGTSFDAVIEFNSDLPKIQMDDGSYFLDHIDAPFYDILLDHPLYHHDMLKQTLENFHVVCLDKNHRDYISENYPHIKSADVISMTGEEILPVKPFLSRSTDILFTGTYTPPNDVVNAIDHCPPFIAKDIKDLIDMMLADETLSLESAVKELAPHTDSLILENFPLHMQAYFLADTYLRAFLREDLLQKLVQAGLPVTIYGSEWDKMPGSDAKSLSIHKSVPYLDTFRLMANAKITLNIMPLFKAGSHDRIPAAMLNHSVAVTDSSTLLQKLYTDKKDILFYSLKEKDTLCDTLHFYLSNPKKMEEIAANGFANANTNSTWEQVGLQFLSILNLN